MKPTPEKPTPRYIRKQASVRRQLLIDAAIRCLADGGMAAFTIARICKEAGVSQGLINHHFKGKEELLICVYDVLTAFLVETVEATRKPPFDPAHRLIMLIDANFDLVGSGSSQLRAWLALWGEISANPDLRELHKERYAEFKSAIADSVAAVAAARGKTIDANTVAMMLVSLIDGLWLESRLDPDALSPKAARSACIEFLEDRLGPLSDKTRLADVG